MKTCTKCKIEKDVSEFGKGERYKDGLRSWCRHCSTAYKTIRLRNAGCCAQSAIQASDTFKMIRAD